MPCSRRWSGASGGVCSCEGGGAQGSVGRGIQEDPTGEFPTGFRGSFRAPLGGTCSEIITPAMPGMRSKVWKFANCQKLCKASPLQSLVGGPRELCYKDLACLKTVLKLMDFRKRTGTFEMTPARMPARVPSWRPPAVLCYSGKGHRAPLRLLWLARETPLGSSIRGGGRRTTLPRQPARATLPGDP